jgi:cell cycle checkpoint protein
VCVTLDGECLKDSFADALLQRLLVLKGPAGSGKTTTVSLLAKAMNFDISEWRNPTVADTGINSFSSQFDDFLKRGGAFGSLEVFSGMPQNKDSGTAMQGDHKERILLVEEFPSTMTLSSSALSSFRNVLLQYLAAAVPPRSTVFEQSKTHLTSHPPIVLVISESLLTSATASTDSFTAHRLLGPDLCNHPYATILEFNPVAPTLVIKALELAIKKEARVSQRRRVPGPAILKRLSELGDIRSAVNGLEFLCVRGDADSDWGGRTAAKKTRSNKSSSSMTSMEKESLELVTQREATLGIFHAVGKVVWNKREDPRVADPGREPPPKPPDHMPTFDRPKASQVETDELLNEIGTDIQTFTAALHENYVLSTNGSHFADSASACIDFLSESDLLSPSSRQTTRSSRPNSGTGGGMMQVGGVDMLRQNEISFQIAVLGLLFSLPSPVRRASHPNGRKGDSFKMFYPASLKIWKPSEEIHDLLSLEMGRLSASGTEGPRSMPSGAAAEGVESWKSRSLSFLPPTDDKSRNDNETSRIWATRDELLLERLPYTARMRPGNDKSTRNLKKITQLTGSGALLNADEDADADNAEGALDLSAADETTDRIASPQKRVGIRRDLLVGKAVGNLFGEGVPEVEKLYISEDDIEDD